MCTYIWNGQEIFCNWMEQSCWFSHSSSVVIVDVDDDDDDDDDITFVTILMITSPSRFRVSSLICETIVSHYTPDIQILRRWPWMPRKNTSSVVSIRCARSLPLRLSHDFLLLYDAQIDDFRGRFGSKSRKKMP